MSVAHGGAGDKGKDDHGGGADGGDLSGGRESRGDGIAEINVDDTRPASVGTRRIVGFHVHAADEARHAGGGNTGGMVATEGKKDVEAVEHHEGVGGGEDIAGDADEDVGVGEERGEGVETGGDIEEGEGETFGHDTAPPGLVTAEVKGAGLRGGVLGKDLLNAVALLVPEGLEFGEDILLLRCADFVCAALPRQSKRVRSVLVFRSYCEIW